MTHKPDSSPEPAGPVDSTGSDIRQAKKAGVTAFVGTTVEWFDFYIYATASALVLGKVFFPEASPAVGTLAAFGTFWVGFLARPIGGIIFGHIGDRHGRKSALIATLSIMGLATFGIGLLPSYDSWGVAAPVILILLRMLQGIAVGGEWGGAVLIATEYAPEGKKVLYGAFAQQGSPAGNLLATMAFLALTKMSDAAFEDWGWRLPFLASAVLVLIGLFIRLKISEPPEMARLIEEKRTSRMPVLDVIRGYPVIIVLGICAGTAGVAIAWVKTTFALSWATTELDFSRGEFLLVILAALVVQFIVQPFGALLVEKMELRRAVLIMLLPEFILLPLMFVLVQTGNIWLAVLGMCLATIPHCLYYAALAGILARLYPVNIRYTGLSLTYQLSTTIFAGTAPIVAQTLLTGTGTIWSVVALGLAYVAITLVAVFLLVRHTATTSDPNTTTNELEYSA